MCGIVGYVGYRTAQDVLIEGLHRLEYRGYDSAGIAVAHNGRIGIRKKAGRVQAVAATLEAAPLPGTVGIGHTRWATHGATTDVNSHPHVGGNGEVVLVHNGVIENHVALRNQLQELGYVFRTGTDTEAIAHLIAHHLDEQTRLGGGEVNERICLSALKQALAMLKGTYGLGILFRDLPNMIIGARLGSPLVIGVGREEFFLASDSSPLIGFTEEVAYLADHEIVVLKPRRDGAVASRHGAAFALGPLSREVHRRHRSRQLRASHAQGDLRATRRRSKTPSAAGSTKRKPPPSSADSTSIRKTCAA